MKYFIHKAEELDTSTSKCGSHVAGRLSKVVEEVVQVANAIKVGDIKAKESVDKVIKRMTFSIPPLLLFAQFFWSVHKIYIVLYSILSDGAF